MGRDGHAVEVAKVLQPLTGPAYRGGVERIALGEPELTADHLVLGAGVALDFEALDIHARALGDVEHQVHGLLRLVAGNARPDVHEGVATVLRLVLQRRRRPVHLFAVVGVARLEQQQRLQVVAVQLRQLAVDPDLADLVPVALTDGERDEKGAAVRRQLGHGVVHLEVGKAILQVEPPQQLLVEVDALGVVLVAAGQDAVERLLAAVDDLAQPVLAEGVVADECDAADQRGLALVDLEHHVHAVLVQVDDLRLDRRGITAGFGVAVQDALPVGLRQLRREHRAGTKLQLAPQLVVTQLVVALEGDAVDDGVLDHLHHQAIALTADGHVLEQASGVQRLEAAVDAVGIEAVTGLHQHVGADRSLLDALVALDLDAGDGPAGCGWTRRAIRACSLLPRGSRPLRALLRLRRRALLRLRRRALLCLRVGPCDQWNDAGGREQRKALRNQQANPPGVSDEACL